MRDRKKRKESNLSWLLYLLLIALILIYALYGNVVVGGVAVILIVIILVFEIRTSISTEGTKKSLIDIGVAVGAAIALWIVLSVVLQTPAPVDAVSSCSMLPVLHRGDLVVLHGLGNVSAFVAQNHVPVINVSRHAFDLMQGNMSNEFLAYFAYVTNASRIAFAIANNTAYNVSLYNTQCASQYSYLGEPYKIAECMVSEQQQAQNLIRYSYALGSVNIGGQVYKAVYTSQISVGNVTLSENYSNPIIVYSASSRDTFSGDIIHRLYAVLNVSGEYYFLTKGDNNQALDIEFGNYPVNSSSAIGYVIADIPIIGYVKLLLSGQIATPAGCNQTLSSKPVS